MALQSNDEIVEFVSIRKTLSLKTPSKLTLLSYKKIILSAADLYIKRNITIRAIFLRISRLISDISHFVSDWLLKQVVRIR